MSSPLRRTLRAQFAYARWLFTVVEPKNAGPYPSLTRGRYHPAYDGLRGVAAWPVLLFHLGFSFVPGALASVDLFFVLSGYLITQIILDGIEGGHFNFAEFYERRVRRILPALFVVIFASVILGVIVLQREHYSELFLSIAAAAALLSNHAVASEVGTQTWVGALPLQPTWSVAIEEQFYVLYPLLLTLAMAHGRRFVVAGMALIGCLSFAAAIYMKPQDAYFYSSARAWEFIIGAALAFDILPLIATRYRREILAAAGAALFLVAIETLKVFSPYQALELIPGTVATAMFIQAERNGPTFVGRILSVRLLTIMGQASYSIYIWHWVLIFCVVRVHGAPGFWMKLVLLAASLIVGLLSWQYVELVFRRRGSVVARNQIFWISGLISFAFVAIGLTGFVAFR